MTLKEVLDNIKAHLTGDPSKDGPYMKEQVEKYKDEPFSEELKREMAEILVEITEKEYKGTLDAFLAQENKKVDEKLQNVEKRFNNRNFSGGIKILEEIIRNNALAWIDTNKYTYKCFGTPLEYLLFGTLFQQETREVRSINCDLSKVYRYYCHGLYKKGKLNEAQRAIDNAIELNPCDPENYIQKGELAKLRHDNAGLKESARMLLKTAVSKKQVGQAYFSYSFYYSEIMQYEKALALLQMSRIFRESPLYETELRYIIDKMGGASPSFYNRDDLMNLLLSENIQPGPSAAVVAVANEVAKKLEDDSEYAYAKYFYAIIYELIENEYAKQKMEELDMKIKKNK